MAYRRAWISSSRCLHSSRNVRGSRVSGATLQSQHPSCIVRPCPLAGLAYVADHPPSPPYCSLRETTCVEQGLVSFRLSGPTRSAGVSAGGPRWLVSSSSSTGDGEASSLASPASRQDLGAIFDVLGGAEKSGGLSALYPVCGHSCRALLIRPHACVCLTAPDSTTGWLSKEARVCVSTPWDTRLWVLWASTPVCF